MELFTGQVIGSNYLIKRIIGEGQFGKVYEATHLRTLLSVAIKQVTNKMLSKSDYIKQLFESEVKNLSSVQNPNVVGFIEELGNDDSRFIIQEYCDSGNLQQLVKQKNGLPESEALHLFKQILNGFKGLHKFNIIHRDFKAENIFLHQKNQVKIGDLGLSKSISKQNVGVSVLGTFLTMAPEVLQEQKYGLEVDVFSFGIVMYFTLFGEYPFFGKNSQEVLFKVKKGNINFNANGKEISQNMKDLLSSMLQYERSKRIQWNSLYSHELLNNNIPEGQKIDMIYMDSDKNKQQMNNPPQATQQIPFQNKQSQPKIQNENQEQNTQNMMVKRLAYKDIQLPQRNNFVMELEEHHHYDNPVIQKPYGILAQRQNIMCVEESAMEEFRQEAQLKLKQEAVSRISEKMKMYFHKKKVLGQLLKVINNAYSLPLGEINPFETIFLYSKLMVQMAKELYFSMVNKENIFNLQAFNQICESNEFKELQKTIKEEIEMYNFQLEELRGQLLEHKNQDNLQAEIEKENLTINFDSLLHEAILKYQTSLFAKRIHATTSDKLKRRFFIHEVEILQMKDLRMFDKLDFDFEKYNEEISQIKPEEFDATISHLFDSF